MTKASKREYFQAIVRRYHTGNRKMKSQILNEFCQVCELNRSYAIRLLNEGYKRKTKRPGRASRYQDPEFLKVLTRIWAATGWVCGKLLKKALPRWIPLYESRIGTIAEPHRKKLFLVSAATIDRLLRGAKARAGKGKSLTKPGSLLRNEIEICGSIWDETRPGFVEADTVAHCGNSSQGPFVLSVTLTDIATQWTESRAIWTKTAERVVAAIQDIEASMPFPIQGFDCDNGSEFLNDHLVRYFKKKRIPLTRSRPYRKNDNAHVEQKNWMHARTLFGYGRFENPDLVPIMNDIYKNLWSPYKNFFIPGMKLKEKIRVGSRIVRKYDSLQAPYDRVMASPDVPEATKLQLTEWMKTLNPFDLKDEIDKRMFLVRKLARISFDEWQLANTTSPSEH